MRSAFGATISIYKQEQKQGSRPRAYKGFCPSGFGSPTFLQRPQKRGAPKKLRSKPFPALTRISVLTIPFFQRKNGIFSFQRQRQKPFPIMGDVDAGPKPEAVTTFKAAEDAK
jgi:hypothetical protein